MYIAACTSRYILYLLCQVYIVLPIIINRGEIQFSLSSICVINKRYQLDILYIRACASHTWIINVYHELVRIQENTAVNIYEFIFLPLYLRPGNLLILRLYNYLFYPNQTFGRHLSFSQHAAYIASHTTYSWYYRAHLRGVSELR